MFANTRGQQRTPAGSSSPKPPSEDPNLAPTSVSETGGAPHQNGILVGRGGAFGSTFSATDPPLRRHHYNLPGFWASFPHIPLWIWPSRPPKAEKNPSQAAARAKQVRSGKHFFRPILLGGIGGWWGDFLGPQMGCPVVLSGFLMFFSRTGGQHGTRWAQQPQTTLRGAKSGAHIGFRNGGAPHQNGILVGRGGCFWDHFFPN